MIRRVLIVEDNPITARLHEHHVRRLLKNPNLEVRLAQDGRIAQQILRTERFDLMLLDLTLPFVSGWELCRQVREADPDGQVRIVVATTQEDPALEVKLRQLGVDGLLRVPVSAEGLQLMLQRLGLLP
jgi:CheY-like chemotaxis protein|nr:MAG: hypothetical protein KatS3mg041_1261 [Bacteroidota bacterium]